MEKLILKMPWKWNNSVGDYVLTGVDAAIASSEKYRSKLGLSKEEYSQALADPAKALVVMQKLGECSGIGWTEAEFATIMNPLIIVTMATPFDEIMLNEEAVVPRRRIEIS